MPLASALGRRFTALLFLGLAAVAAVIGFRALSRPHPADVLPTVEVEVVDPQGKPVDRASVQCRFRPGWTRVDSRGLAVLEEVMLRAGEEPTAEAIEAALEVRAPHHALPWGMHPVLVESAKGRWHARYVLHGYGAFRLSIKDTNLPAPKAWAEAVGPSGSVEAIDGAQVARIGQPAKYRIYEGVERLRLHLTGATGTVTRVTEAEPPAVGFDREVELVAEEAAPIHGRIVAEGDVHPPLIGHVRVFQSGETEAIELPRLGLLPGEGDSSLGTFDVPYAGRDRYRIVPHLEGIEIEPVVAKGGDDVELVARATSPWIAVRGVAWRDETYRVLYRLAPFGPEQVPNATLSREGDALLFFVPEPTVYRVAVDVPGTAKRPPRQGEAEVTVGASGGHPAELEVTDRPFGEVVVTIEDPPAKGATVELLAPDRRTGTLLPGLGSVVTIRHVAAGLVRAKVTRRDADATVVLLEGTLEAGGTLSLDAGR